MKNLIFIAFFIFLLQGCNSWRTETEEKLSYGESQYRKIIGMDSLIFENYVHGELTLEGARSLIKMQSNSADILKCYLDYNEWRVK